MLLMCTAKYFYSCYSHTCYVTVIWQYMMLLLQYTPVGVTEFVTIRSTSFGIDVAWSEIFGSFPYVCA